MNYIDFINDSNNNERYSYSFTCSAKNIEERVIIAYLSYLKDNNIAYGRMLKDILYNLSVENFGLSIPLKNIGKTTISNKNHNDPIGEDHSIEEILENTKEILKLIKDNGIKSKQEIVDKSEHEVVINDKRNEKISLEEKYKDKSSSSMFGSFC